MLKREEESRVGTNDAGRIKLHITNDVNLNDKEKNKSAWYRERERVNT